MPRPCAAGYRRLHAACSGCANHLHDADSSSPGLYHPHAASRRQQSGHAQTLPSPCGTTLHPGRITSSLSVRPHMPHARSRGPMSWGPSLTRTTLLTPATRTASEEVTRPFGAETGMTQAR
jgi:hypothetical protein